MKILNTDSVENKELSIMLTWITLNDEREIE